VLDIQCAGISFHYRDGPPVLQGLDLRVERTSHVALIGHGGAGKSTLLRVVAGELRPEAGSVFIGSHDVSGLSRRKRPLLFVNPDHDFSLRWSVTHVLVAALQRRSLDRTDRLREFDRLIELWSLQSCVNRKARDLSSHERVLLRLARIEAARPGILIAQRMLDGAAPSQLRACADQIYRSLRVIGSTVISEITHLDEMGMCDQVLVLAEGRIVQAGTSQEVYRNPVTTMAAASSGRLNSLPVHIEGTRVHSPIGEWDLLSAPFQGSGTAMARPSDFALAGPSDESDFVFSVEEAQFSQGVWHLAGFITGVVLLHVELPEGTRVHKGRLLPLRYSPENFRLYPSEQRYVPGPPTDLLPSREESR